MSLNQRARGIRATQPFAKKQLVVALAAAFAMPAMAATVTWDGGGGNSFWSTAYNWDGNVLPGILDTAQIGTGITAVLSSSASITSLNVFTGGVIKVNSGSLSTTGASNVAEMMFNGTLSGPGIMTIRKASIIGGTMTGSGSTILASDGSHSMSGAYQYLRGGRTLRNDGQLAVGSTTNDVKLYMDGSSGSIAKTRLVNQGELVFQGTRSSYVLRDQGNPDAELENNGKLIKRDSGYTGIGVKLINNGQIIVDPGATLSLSTNSVHSGGASFSGAIVLSSGTHSFADGFSTSGAGLTDLQGGTLEVTSGTARFGNMKVTSLIQGSGNLSIANAAINGGTMTGSGSTILASDGSHSMSGAYQYLRGGRTLRNDGQLAVGSTTNDVKLYMDGSSGSVAKTRLVSQGELVFQGTRSTYVLRDQGNPDAELENNGKLIKRDSGYTQINTRVSNTNQIVVEGGTLNLGGRLTNQGDIHVQQGLLNYTGGSSTAQLQNDGKIVIDSGARFLLGPNTALVNNGRLMGNGSLELANANLENHGVVAPGSSAGILNVTGNYVQGADGRLDIELGGLLPGVNYDRLQVNGITVNGQTLYGNATLNGVLDITHLAGYAPNIGDSFIVLASSRLYGTFSSLSLHGFGNGTQINVSYLDGNDADSYADYVRLDVAAVPEPETYAMMLAGLGVVGWSLRKRKLAVH
jgi:hypothetical protein